MMKKESIPPKKGFLIYYRITMAVIIALVLVIAAGSIFAIIRPAGADPVLRIGGRESRDLPLRRLEADGMFTGIGRLRIPVSLDPPSTIVVSISFPYPQEDRRFAEELASRVGEFRAIADDYFSSLPAQALLNLDDDAAKANLIRSYNTLLRLGRIETMYFTDFMVID